ncbi:MAG: hypothetical protein JJE02_02290 [Propionibacteriales bacterium]|nr:hypothetical protein [Propionibacteriales bacterium]
MGDRRLLSSGDVLAGRYELQDLVSEKRGSATWRATDNILNRNVGLEMLPASDLRVEAFLEAARHSTVVTDPRFLPVLDVIEDEKGHSLVVREWARAFSLDQLLSQSPLPNRRAATVVSEVAEALAHAHEAGIHHMMLTPHMVLLKQSGAVRVTGLGVASALASAGTDEAPIDAHASEQLDVQSLGKLLYACLVSRWPGGVVDGLRAAPTEHGRLLRPRQVRAGVSRDADTVCDRILGTPPRNHESPLRSAASIARTLRLAGDDENHLVDEQPSLARLSSPDLLRLDPVIVPTGPPPGINPPRRRPKAFEPAPPTTFERSKERALRATRGSDRALIFTAIGVVVVLAALLAFLVGRSTNDGGSNPLSDSAPPRLLSVSAVNDFDPFGSDGSENANEARFASDGDIKTGWRTSTYFSNSKLGGLKPGVGLVFDLGGPREVNSIRVRLAGQPTDLRIYASMSGAAAAPTSLKGLSRIATLDNVVLDGLTNFESGVLARYVVVMLTNLPSIDDGRYRGEIREVTFRGRS